jgi:hypothetical protein
VLNRQRLPGGAGSRGRCAFHQRVPRCVQATGVSTSSGERVPRRCCTGPAHDADRSAGQTGARSAPGIGQRLLDGGPPPGPPAATSAAAGRSASPRASAVAAVAGVVRSVAASARRAPRAPPESPVHGRRDRGGGATRRSLRSDWTPHRRTAAPPHRRSGARPRRSGYSMPWSMIHSREAVSS